MMNFVCPSLPAGRFRVNKDRRRKSENIEKRTANIDSKKNFTKIIHQTKNVLFLPIWLNYLVKPNG